MENTTFILILLLVTGATVFIAHRLITSGAFSRTEDYNIEDCHTIANVIGPENLHVDSTEDVLYISSNNWEAFNKGQKLENGGIYMLDLKQINAEPKLISIDAPAEFKPHGIDLYQDPNTGEKTLFVVNNKESHPTIEAFDVIDRETIKHRETFSNAQLISPNDVKAMGGRSFYVSQDIKYALKPWKVFLATLFGLEGGSVFYFDGNNWKVVAQDIHFANAIACSQDQRRLYLGETNKMRIRVYDRNQENGDLFFKEYIPLKAGPDNINIDSQGNLWVAGYPNMLAIAKHLGNKSAKSPVQITKLTFDGDKLLEMKNMLTSSGNIVSGISAVDVYKDKMIISGPVHTEVRVCSLPREMNYNNPNIVDI